MSKAAKFILIVFVLGSLMVAGLMVLGFERMAGLDHDSQRLIVFHAGSLTVPFKQICEQFSRHYPKIKIIREAAGSRVCARKVADLKRPCDLVACSDYTVIDSLLIPEYAEWNIKFASNEMVIAFRKGSRRAGDINKGNWYDILLETDVAFGRSDPNADPCGYRTILVMMLAEKFYNRPDLAGRMLAKDRKYIRPKEVDLLSLLEIGELDYIFIYRSIAKQHKLDYIVLPDEINLKNAAFADFYKSASVRLVGKKPGSLITRAGEPIIYGVTVLKNAPNPELALTLLTFLLDANGGGAIFERNGQTSVVPSPTDTFNRIPDCLKIFALPVEQEDKR